MRAIRDIAPGSELWDRYLAEVAKDRHCRALPTEGRCSALRASLDFAIQSADETAARFPGRDGASGLREALAAHGVRIVEMSPVPGCPMLAEYRADNKTIEIYPEKIRQTEAALGRTHPEFFAVAGLSDMCLAHEYLHHLDFRRHGCIGGFAAIMVKRFGLFRRTHYPESAGEVAAHEFVRLWYGLSFSPIAFYGMLAEGGLNNRRGQVPV